MDTVLDTATKHDETVSEAIANIAHLKNVLEVAEQHERDSVIARDKFLSEQLRDRGMSVLTDAENTDLASSVYGHILDALDRGWSVNSSSPAPRTSTALGDVVRSATSAECRYHRLRAVSGNPDGFFVTIYPHKMEHMNISADTAADKLSSMFEAHLDAHCPDTIFALSVRRLLLEESEKAGNDRYIYETYSIRRKQSGGWSMLNQVDGARRYWDHFDADTSVKTILLDCLVAKSS